MLRKTAEGNDCGRITATNIIKRQGIKITWANFQPAIIHVLFMSYPCLIHVLFMSYSSRQFVPRSKSFAFRMRPGDFRSHRASDNILPGL